MQGRAHLKAVLHQPDRVTAGSSDCGVCVLRARNPTD